MLSVIAYFCLRNPTLRIAGNTGYPHLAVKTILAPRFPKQKNFPPIGARLDLLRFFHICETTCRSSETVSQHRLEATSTRHNLPLTHPIPGYSRAECMDYLASYLVLLT
jgi:hypothetical protein